MDLIFTRLVVITLLGRNRVEVFLDQSIFKDVFVIKNIFKIIKKEVEINK